MADICIFGTDARRRDGQRRTRSPTRWTPRWPRCAASRSWSRGSRPPRRRPREEDDKKAEGGKTSKKVAAKNLAVFTRQFSVMIDAGSAARPVPRHPRHPGRGQELRRGHPADADRRRRRRVARRRDAASIPKTFDPLFTNMIAAGEAGGILDTILKRLATYIEKAVKLKGQVKSAMIYPDRRHRHRRPSSSASFCGRSSRRSRRCSPASAPNCRCPTRIVIALSNNLVGTCRSSSAAVGARRLRRSAGTTGRDGGRASIDALMLKMPVLGMICARSRSRGSAARSRRSSAPACRFSTASRSRRRRRATPSSRTRSW